MKVRKKALGDRNLIGERVYQIRTKQNLKQKDLLARIQTYGIDMNASGLSKLEGQTRSASDKELLALSEILHVPVALLLEGARN